MGEAKRTEVFDVTKDAFFDVLLDFESYPDFVDGVSSVTIHNKTKTKSKVTFELNLIKKFKYTLDMEHKNGKLSWKLSEGDLFKKNNGEWILEETDNGLEVTYFVDIDFKGLVPKMVTNKLVGKNLPAMMKSYYERAKNG